MFCRLEQAGTGVAKALGISEGAEIVHIRRVRLVDGEPLCVEDAYLNASVVPGLVERGTPASIFAALTERDIRPTWVEDTVTAEPASAADASLLGIAVDAAVLHRQRRCLAGEQIVMASHEFFRGDSYSLRINLPA